MACEAHYVERRRHQKAIERQDRGYPGALGRTVPTVTDDEWMSQFDAAEDLAVSMARIGFLIQGRQLEPVHDGRGRAGGRRSSVDREADRRAGVGTLKKVRIFLADVGRSLAGGI